MSFNTPLTGVRENSGLPRTNESHSYVRHGEPPSTAAGYQRAVPSLISPPPLPYGHPYSNYASYHSNPVQQQQQQHEAAAAANTIIQQQPERQLHQRQWQLLHPQYQAQQIKHWNWSRMTTASIEQPAPQQSSGQEIKAATIEIDAPVLSNRELLGPEIEVYENAKNILGRAPMIADLIGPTPRSQDDQMAAEVVTRRQDGPSNHVDSPTTELYSDRELSMMFAQLLSDSPDDSYLLDG